MIDRNQLVDQVINNHDAIVFGKFLKVNLISGAKMDHFVIGPLANRKLDETGRPVISGKS